MKTKVAANYFAQARLPALLCVASGSTSADRTGEVTFSKITDATTGKNITILSNLENTLSPFTGEKLEASAPNIETASLDSKDVLSAFVCVAQCLKCSHDLHTVPELAEQLDTQTIHCTNCGEEVTAYYDGDFAAADDDMSEDDLEEDDSEDVVDALDEDTDAEEDTMEEDDTTSEDDEEDPDANPDEVDETSDGESEDSTSEDDDSVTSEEDQADDEEEEDVSQLNKASAEAAPVTTETTPAPITPAVETTPAPVAATEVTPVAAETTPAPVVEAPVENPEVVTSADVVVASVADYTGDLQFATLSDTSRVEVFLGNSHIGSILKDEAADSVQRIFAKQDVLRNAFGRAFWSNSTEICLGDTSKLDEFGFKPSTVRVALNRVVANIVEEKVADLEKKQDEAIQEAVASVVTSMNVAAAGVNKGILPGTNLYSELAKLLSTYGVQKAEEVAERFVTKVTPKFFSSVVTASADLRGESPEYVRGLATSIETAAFVRTATTAEDPTLVTSALLPTPKREQPNTVVHRNPTVVDTASAHNNGHIGSVFSRYGRR